MAASDHEAQAIRLQLVELSEHILRRLAILLARARADGRMTYPDVEATARDISNVQRELMDELARPMSRREEMAHLMGLMRVQDRSLSVLEQLERLPFNQAAVPLQTARSVGQRPSARADDTIEIAPWPEDEGFADPPPPPAPRRGRSDAPPPEPDRSRAPGRLQTWSSAGQPYPVMPGQAPVRSRPRTPDPVEPPPRRPPPSARSQERPPGNPPRTAPPPRRDAPPTAPSARSAPTPPAPSESKRSTALPVPVATSPERESEVAELGHPSARERAANRLLDLWDMFRRVPQMTITAVFLVLGVVALVLVGRLAMVVAQGLTSPGNQVAAQQRVEERLPAEDGKAASADARAKALLPPTGDAFVVVLSMHPDAATAQRTFAEMRQRMATTLTGLKPDIQPMETPNGIRYRLALAPPMSRERAFAVCSEFKAAGFQACWLRRLQR
jgi:hypothetical protein